MVKARTGCSPPLLLPLLEAPPFEDACADVVLCNAVLHFARDLAHCEAMVRGLWRLVRPGGLLFCRLGSRIGMDFSPTGDGRYRVGSDAVWFLVDEPMLMRWTAALGGTLVDPLKTTVVQHQPLTGRQRHCS